MNSAEVIMILTLCLTAKIAIGQPLPKDCVCYTAASIATSCRTPGCSLGNNPYCDGTFDAAPDRFGTLNFHRTGGSSTGRASYFGCNCPGSSSTATSNGYYSADLTSYNYTTCTAYGGNARTSFGRVPDDAYLATGCCNFCCNRTDPSPGSTTPSPTTPSPTTPSPTTPSPTTPSPTTPSPTTPSTTTESPTTSSTTTESSTTPSTTTESTTTESSTTASTAIVTTTTEPPTAESSTTASTAIVTTTTEPPPTGSSTPEPPTTEQPTPPTAPATTPVSSGRKFVLDKWLYLSGLILLVLVTLKIN